MSNIKPDFDEDDEDLDDYDDDLGSDDDFDMDYGDEQVDIKFLR